MVYTNDFFAYNILVMSEIILPCNYLGSVQYFSKLIAYQHVFIEQMDSYQKQTYRNRCRILGGNGVIDLTIPVVKNSGQKTLLKDVKIENITNWQHKHWRTIVSAYNSSPFFEYYTEDLQPFYQKKFEYLVDYNMQLMEVLAEILEMDELPSLTDEYDKNPSALDYRSVMSPKYKGSDPHFEAREYTQTFHERFGFIANLSVVDLLFNKGPETSSFLNDCFIP